MTCPCKEMREKAARAIEPYNKRPCDCRGCDCGNVGNAMDVAQWDADTSSAATIRALPLCGKCDTHVWVPKEPDDVMLDAGCVRVTLQFQNHGISDKLKPSDAIAVYKAMLAAREDK